MVWYNNNKLFKTLVQFVQPSFNFYGFRFLRLVKSVLPKTTTCRYIHLERMIGWTGRQTVYDDVATPRKSSIPIYYLRSPTWGGSRVRTHYNIMYTENNFDRNQYYYSVMYTLRPLSSQDTHAPAITSAAGLGIICVD